MTDYKQLCVELLDSAKELDDLIEGIRLGNYMPDSFTLQPMRAVLERARAALAEPEPLTDCPSAVLKRAREINDMMAVTVYGPHEPDECAASWVTSKMLASLEARIAVLESCSATPCSEND